MVEPNNIHHTDTDPARALGLQFTHVAEHTTEGVAARLAMLGITAEHTAIDRPGLPLTIEPTK